MYRLLIVDDEVISRLGVSNLLDWNEYGFELVDIVSNGQEAINVMRKQLIDLVITDIKMPVMSGIDLIKNSKNEKLNATFIVLSSFNDYEYVREALKLGAIDYVLKLDLDADYMKCLLEKAKEDISTKNNSRERTQITDKQTIRIARKEFLKQLLFGQTLVDESFNKKCNKISLNLPYNKFTVLMFETDNTNNRIDNEGIMDIIEEVLLDYEFSYVCDTGFEEFSIIYNFENSSENRMHQLIQQIARRISFIMKQYFNQKIVIYFSQIFEEISKLSVAYLQVCQAKSLKSFTSDSMYIYYSDVMSNRSKRDYGTFENYIRRIELVYNNESDEKINVIFDELYIYINKSKYIELEQVRYFISSLVYITNKYIDKLGYSRQLLWKDEEHKYKVLQSIKRKADFLEFLKTLEKKLNELEIDNNDNYAIRNVKKYLKQHYSENIIIKEIASKFGMTNTYLSALFKKETGVTVKDYLISLKIEKAKYLLKETNEQISQIAYAIGYDNEHYFSRIFRQKTSKTPTQFRNQSK